MKTNLLLQAAAAVAIPVGTLPAAAVEGKGYGDPIDLSILYVGHPDSERERDFVAFLSEHFARVETADMDGIGAGDLPGHDVAILDYDGDGFEAPRPSISRDHDGPVLTVGVVGAFICDSLSLKTGYL